MRRSAFVHQAVLNCIGYVPEGLTGAPPSSLAADAKILADEVGRVEPFDDEPGESPYAVLGAQLAARHLGRELLGPKAQELLDAAREVIERNEQVVRGKVSPGAPEFLATVERFTAAVEAFE